MIRECFEQDAAKIATIVNTVIIQLFNMAAKVSYFSEK